MLSTCDLSDRFPEARVADAVLRDFGGRRQFSGLAVTVKCFEDNSRVKELLATRGDGRVLVVDGGGSLRCALLGDMIARDAVSNGWAGLIIDGCVRDTSVLATLPIGIKARAAVPRRSIRRGEGATNIDIQMAGTHVASGDLIVADEDGVLILAAALAAKLDAT
jgi:regulator of ribonuclease activity A